jgi:chaperonin cofactor prefoldin
MKCASLQSELELLSEVEEREKKCDIRYNNLQAQETYTREEMSEL